METARTGTGGHYHLVGAAGVGMSAVAQMLIALGHTVSGSDRYFDMGDDLEVIRKLEAAGMRFVAQDGSGVTVGTRAVVVSTAIEKDNPDILRAVELDVPVLHRSRVIADFSAGRQCVAVTGTSGKSTVTAMTGWILEQLGADPMVVNGAVVLDWAGPDRVGNVRVGKSDLWVIEADESDRSLLNFKPDWAVITNESRDHFDLQETKDLFAQFVRSVRRGVITHADVESRSGQWNLRLSTGGSRFSADGVEFSLSIPGIHNAENALQAVLICGKLGFSLQKMVSALSNFRGLHRRLEVVGRACGVTVVDDYSHNPAKIRAAWSTLAPCCKRVIAVWRPHGFGPLKAMMRELVAVFSELCSGEDHLFLMPSYYAGGTADRSVDSPVLADALKARSVRVEMADTHDAVLSAVLPLVREGDLVLVMGARDPDLPVLARRIFKSIIEDGLRKC